MSKKKQDTKIKLKIIDKEFYSYSYSKPDNLIHYKGQLEYNNDLFPKYETKESAGMDLCTMKDFILRPNEQILIPTGIAIHIDDPSIGGFILPRSGLGHKQGIVLGNLVGLIDSDYQGEIKLSIWNRSHVIRYFNRGDKIAQLVFMPIIRATLEIVEEFQPSERGEGGFGSTS